MQSDWVMKLLKTTRIVGSTFIAITAISGLCMKTWSDDWPRYMGTDASGVYADPMAITEIPPEGLPIAWRQSVGGGYAGPAVADGRVFVLDYERKAGEPFNNPGERANLNGDERLLVFDAATGRELWRASYACPYSISYPAGPRCTPTIDGDRVYTLGAEGDLQCRHTSDGDLIWSRSLKNDLKAEVPIWGFASHPLVDGNLLYTMVGGDGQAVVAFDKMTGEVVWKALDSKTGYCPLSILERGGKRHLIVFHPYGIDGLDPMTGANVWGVALEPMYEMSINQPVVSGNMMYASGIRTTSVMLQLNDDGSQVKELWRGERDRSVFTSNSTAQFVEGVIYGTDCNVGSLIAVDAKSGDRFWETFQATRPEERRFVKHGTAFITRLGESDRYLLFSEMGDLILATLTRDGYVEHGRMHVVEPTGEAFGRNVVWSHPAYADGMAFIRNDKELVAVSIRQN